MVNQNLRIPKFHFKTPERHDYNISNLAGSYQENHPS